MLKWLEKRQYLKRWEMNIKKNAVEIFNKKKEIHELYLSAGKRKDKSWEDFYKG